MSLRENNDDRPVVFIPSENARGVVLRLGAYGSVVKYTVGGIEYEVFMDNDDLVFLDDLIGYEEEIA